MKHALQPNAQPAKKTITKLMMARSASLAPKPCQAAVSVKVSINVPNATHNPTGSSMKPSTSVSASSHTTKPTPNARPVPLIGHTVPSVQLKNAQPANKLSLSTPSKTLVTVQTIRK